VCPRPKTQEAKTAGATQIGIFSQLELGQIPAVRCLSPCMVLAADDSVARPCTLPGPKTTEKGG
jgi:hypothetical protein